MKYIKNAVYIKNVLVVMGAIILMGCMILDMACVLFFSYHYFEGTIVNGEDISGETVKQAEAKIKSEADQYILEIEGRKGMHECIKAEEIGFHYEVDDSLKNIKKAQLAWQWPMAIWQDKCFKVSVTPEYDEEQLKKRISELDFMDPLKQIPPEDAKVKYIAGRYEVVAGNEGALLNVDKVQEVIKEAVAGEMANVDLDAAKCYETAELTISSTVLNTLKYKLNQYVEADISYEFGDRREKIPANKINSWLKVINMKGKQFSLEQLKAGIREGEVSINEEAIKNYVEELADRYDTLYKTREFRTSEGKMIQVPRGDYGWVMDREKEADTLIWLMENRQGKVTRIPEYKQDAYCRNADDIGKSYVEVNLTKQHLWFYVDGVLVTEGDIVSGMGTNKHATPAGVYSIDYKKKNAILRGPGYACPVSYWMPFYDGMGIHDATWRGRFGGSIYMYDGSHGCINSPLVMAKTIFEKMEDGMPIVCYKD